MCIIKIFKGDCAEKKVSEHYICQNFMYKKKWNQDDEIVWSLNVRSYHSEHYTCQNCMYTKFEIKIMKNYGIWMWNNIRCFNYLSCYVNVRNILSYISDVLNCCILF